MADRTHEVKFPDDEAWTDLTSYVQYISMEIDEFLMNEGYRAAKDVYRFVIQDYTSTIHNKFYSANDVILFRALDGETAVFTGKIDPNFRQQVDYLMQPLVLEAEDNSYLLDEPVQTSFTYPALVGDAAYKIFDSGDTDNSIIHLLLTAAGYDIGTDIDLIGAGEMSMGLIGYWALDDGEGAIAIDGSGNNNDGALEGPAPTWIDGISGKAINFPGANERVDCGNGAPLDNIGNGDFSISLWMKSKDAVPLRYSILFSKRQNTTNRLLLRGHDTDNRLSIHFEKAGVIVDGPFSTDSAPFDTTWHHIVFTVNRTTDLVFAYVDTVKDSTELDISTLANDASNAGNVSWGAIHDAGNPYEGALDEFRIYNRVLTQDDINFLFTYPNGIFLGEPPPNITTTIQHVAATAEEITYWEFIDDILHFHGFVFRWTADGKYTHVNWAPATVVAAHTFLDDLAAVKPLSITKKENDFDGVEVEWSLLDTISDARLYQDQSVPTDADGNFTGLAIAAGTFYPLNADVEDIFQQYEQRWLDIPFARLKNEDIDLIATSGHSIDDSYDAGLVRSVSYESLRAKIDYENPTGGTLKLYYLYVYGDALFRLAIKFTTSKVFVGAKSLRKIVSRHLYNETVATKYAIAMRNNFEYGDFLYDFFSKSEVEVGTFAAVQYTDPVNSRTINTAVIVVRKRKNKNKPLYNYLGFGITEYSLEGVTKRGLYPILRAQLDYLLQTRSERSLAIRVGKDTFVDYLTDGVADEIQINAAITVMNAAGGGRVILSSIVFNIGSPGIQLKAGVILQINGATIHRDWNGPLIWATGNSENYLGGMGVTGPGTLIRDDVFGQQCFYIQYSEDFLLRDIRIEDFAGTAIYIDHGRNAFLNNITVFNMSYVNDMRGLHFYRSTGTIKDIIVDGNNAWKTLVADDYGIVIYAAADGEDGNILVQNCVAKNIYADKGMSGFWIFAYNNPIEIVNCQVLNIKCSERRQLWGFYCQYDDIHLINNVIKDVQAWYPAQFNKNIAGIMIDTDGKNCIIEGNQIKNIHGPAIRINEAGSVNTQVKSNTCIDNGNQIDRGNCEGAVSPMFAGETVIVGGTNCTWDKSVADKYEGAASWLMTKTSEAGAGSALQSLQDGVSTVDMHGLIAALEYTISCRGKVPVAGDIGKYILHLAQYYSGTWNYTSIAMTEVGVWELLSSNLTLNAATTGVAVQITIDKVEAVNSLFYIDNVRLQPIGVHNEHSQQFSDAGAGTQEDGNSWMQPF